MTTEKQQIVDKLTVWLKTVTVTIEEVITEVEALADSATFSPEQIDAMKVLGFAPTEETFAKTVEALPDVKLTKAIKEEAPKKVAAKKDAPKKAADKAPEEKPVADKAEAEEKPKAAAKPKKDAGTLKEDKSYPAPPEEVTIKSVRAFARAATGSFDNGRGFYTAVNEAIEEAGLPTVAKATDSEAVEMLEIIESVGATFKAAQDAVDETKFGGK